MHSSRLVLTSRPIIAGPNNNIKEEESHMYPVGILTCKRMPEVECSLACSGVGDLPVQVNCMSKQHVLNPKPSMGLLCGSSSSRQNFVF